MSATASSTRLGRSRLDRLHLHHRRRLVPAQTERIVGRSLAASCVNPSGMAVLERVEQYAAQTAFITALVAMCAI